MPAPTARLFANIQATGKDGGHDLHYRTLQAMGVNLLGRLAAVDGHHVRFADDLAESVAWGDARYADFGQLLAAQLGGRAPHWPDPPPFRADTPVELNLRGFGAVIFTSGFRPDYAGWVRFPAFDSMGFPITDDGASTVVPGLYFCGVHFLRTRGSSLWFGVGEDAAVVARAVARRYPIGNPNH
jgi:putative flavoprotein involved in K+ transport